MAASVLVTKFENIVGKKNVIHKENATAYYRKGFRSGNGGALCVVFPTKLQEMWDALQQAVDANCAVIIQGAKTGLTEGSNPSGFDEYDREMIIINTAKLKKIYLLDGGKQVLAFAGATLHELEKELKKVNRAPHSVIGSTTIGATIVGSLANNAGGALCKRGPSYTELSLYGQVDKDGKLNLVDRLGIKNLGETPEQIFSRLESGNIPASDLEQMDALASDREYEQRIRDIDADVPTRYNADPKRLNGVSGSAGKVAAFAVRLDTYPVPERKQVFYLGTNDPKNFMKLREHILRNFKNLPDYFEYMNRQIFETTEKYGKDVFLSIKYMGTEKLPRAYALKSTVEHYLHKIPFLPRFMPDLMLYYASKLFPQHLPKRLLDYRDKYEYYLIMNMSDEGIDEARAYLNDVWAKEGDVGFFECEEAEGAAALLHRFAAAGAAIRYQNVHQRSTEEVLAIDVALMPNDPNFIEELPADVTKDLELALYYGHYACHVFHQDYIFRKGADLKAIKKSMLKMFAEKDAKLPAEHNVGHIYVAEPPLADFYKELDPTNTFNPGIGMMSKKKYYA